MLEIPKPPRFVPGWNLNSQPSDIWQTYKPSCRGVPQEDSCKRIVQGFEPAILADRGYTGSQNDRRKANLYIFSNL